MWTASTMTFTESLMVSALGLTIVLAALMLLALAIIIFSKGLYLAGVGVEKTVSSSGVAAGQNNMHEEEFAVLLTAVSEEVGLPLHEFKITKITEIV